MTSPIEPLFWKGLGERHSKDDLRRDLNVSLFHLFAHCLSQVRISLPCCKRSYPFCSLSLPDLSSQSIEFWLPTLPLPFSLLYLLYLQELIHVFCRLSWLKAAQYWPLLSLSCDIPRPSPLWLFFYKWETGYFKLKRMYIENLIYYYDYKKLLKN